MFSPQKKKGQSCNEMLALGGNHFAIYKCVKSTRWTPSAYAVLYIDYISVTLGGKRARGKEQSRQRGSRWLVAGRHPHLSAMGRSHPKAQLASLLPMKGDPIKRSRKKCSVAEGEATQIARAVFLNWKEKTESTRFLLRE